MNNTEQIEEKPVISDDETTAKNIETVLNKIEGVLEKRFSHKNPKQFLNSFFKAVSNPWLPCAYGYEHYLYEFMNFCERCCDNVISDDNCCRFSCNICDDSYICCGFSGYNEYEEHCDCKGKFCCENCCDCEHKVQISPELTNFHQVLDFFIKRFKKRFKNQFNKECKDSIIYNNTGMTKQTFSRIKNNAVKQPTTESILQLALGMKLTWLETLVLADSASILNELREGVGNTVLTAIFSGNYDIDDINEELESKYGKTLGFKVMEAQQ